MSDQTTLTPSTPTPSTPTSSTPSTTVWHVYRVHLDGRDEVKFSLNSTWDSLDKAKKQAALGLEKQIKKLKEVYEDEWEDLIVPVHDDMNKKNSYCYVGPRKKCRTSGGTRWLSLCGWVIEKIQTNTLIE